MPGIRYDRIIRALSLEEPGDKVPCYEGLLSCADHVTGRKVITNTDFDEAESDMARERLICQAVDDLIETADKLDWSLIMVYAPFFGDWHLKAVSRLRGTVDGKFLVGSWVNEGVHTIPPGSEMERFCYRLADEPEGVHEEAKSKLESANIWGKQCVEAGSEILILADDVAYNQGTFLSPSQFGEFIAPYLSGHVSYLKTLGAWVVFHSDGNLMSVLDQIVATGIHGLNPIDPMAGMDIREIKRAYGNQIALFGNVQCDLVHRGPKEAIRESAKYCLESAKAGGGLVYCTSSEVFVDTPWENYQEVIEARELWGCYEPEHGG